MKNKIIFGLFALFAFFAYTPSVSAQVDSLKYIHLRPVVPTDSVASYLVLNKNGAIRRVLESSLDAEKVTATSDFFSRKLLSTDTVSVLIIGHSYVDVGYRGAMQLRKSIRTFRQDDAGIGFFPFANQSPPSGTWYVTGGTVTTTSNAIVGRGTTLGNGQVYRIYGTTETFNKVVFYTENGAGKGTVTGKNGTTVVYTANIATVSGRTKHEIT